MIIRPKSACAAVPLDRAGRPRPAFHFNRFLAFLAVPLFAAVAPGAAPSVPDVLARFDEAAASFHAASAQFRQISHTAVIDDDTEDRGSMVIYKAPNHDLNGLMEYLGKDRRSVSINRGAIQIFHPKTNSVEVYELGKHGEQVVQFLLIGFGTSGKELAANYQVRVLPTNPSGPPNTTRLELVPKSPDALKYLKKVDLWIQDGAAYPVQEKLYQPSGDYTLVVYSGLQVNPTLPKEALEMKLPKNVRFEHPMR